MGEQRGVGRDDDDDRSLGRAADRLLLVPRRRAAPRSGSSSPTWTPSTIRRSRSPWFAWTSTPDGPAVLSALDHARCGPRASLEVVADHPGAAADVALGDRAVRRRVERREEVLGPDVHAVDVVQRAVVGLPDDREAPERRPSLAAPHLVGDERVADDADAVRVRDRDRRREAPGLAHPLEPGHLAVAVQRVTSRRTTARSDAVVRDDRGDAGPDRTLPDLERAVAVDQASSRRRGPRRRP